MSNTVNIRIFGSDFLITEGISALINAMPAYNLLEPGKESLYEQVTSVSPGSPKPDLLIIVLASGASPFYEQIASIINNTSTKILLVIGTIEKESIQKFKKIGVEGIITKQCSKDEITNAIRTTLAGQPFFCGKILDVLLNDEQSNGTKKGAHLSLLSKRELEVFSLIIRRNTTSEIAELLNLSIHTINSHRKHILKKLNLKSPIELIVYALENNLME